MKKLSLNSNAFSKGEVLTRTQLKKIIGGDGSGSESVTCWCNPGPGGFSPRPDFTSEELMELTAEYCGDRGATCYPV